MIKLVKVATKDAGQVKAHEFLKKLIDPKTLLLLSGGTTPDYQKIIVKPGDIIPGALAIVDERYGSPFHENSNELLLKKAGIKNWADEYCIETHKLLKGKKPTQTAADYEREITDLFKRFKKRVGVMGIGGNIHTAGIFPYSEAGKSADLVVSEVIEDKYPQRVTLTLKALGKCSAFVIMMFGKDKKEALELLLDKDQNDMQKYPAIFYRKSKIPAYLITDIKL
ncbi:6-phosphogluconolactonase [Candidatus Curtissbacteria bacterium]|nr:6-phosphogluconolactonase [Candidatus Curtissbacteria bacterium]